jgi:hypothetical protein
VSASLWLARRELSARRGRAALAVLVVAAAAALVTSTEILARGREEAIAAQIDALGAPLRIVPRGVSAEAIARYELGDASLPADAEARARAALGGALRAVEARRVAAADVEGAVMPVVAASSGPARVEPGKVALGSAAAERLRGRSAITIRGEALSVAASLPATATIDDTALYVPAETIDRVGAPGSPGELRIFLSPGADARAASQRLSADFPDAQVLRSDRGEVADGELDGALARHRVAVYLVAVAVAALCLLIAAHLDAAERRTELATLVAVGATRPALAGMVVARSTLIAAAGAVGGIAIAIALAATLDAAPIAVLALALGPATSVLGGAIGVAAIAALAPALAAAARDPVGDLQDG